METQGATVVPFEVFQRRLRRAGHCAHQKEKTLVEKVLAFFRQPPQAEILYINEADGWCRTCEFMGVVQGYCGSYECAAKRRAMRFFSDWQ